MYRKKTMHYFCDLTEEEISKMSWCCEQAAIKYADEIGMMGGFSVGGGWNVYKMLRENFHSEWLKARKAMKVTGPGNGGPHEHK